MSVVHVETDVQSFGFANCGGDGQLIFWANADDDVIVVVVVDVGVVP
jgi:hypothetical protein